MPTHTEKLAYWFTFAIPAIFILLRIIVQRLIDGPPWRRKHFYIGLDLSIFSLAASLVNVIDQLRLQGEGFTERTFSTLALVVVILLVLVYQITVHQQWERTEITSAGKTWMLCVVSNLIGASLVGAFVYLKLRDSI